MKVVAYDKDKGDNGKVSYSIMEMNNSKGRFRIHPHSGVIYTTMSLIAGQEFTFNVSHSSSVLR